MTDQLAETPVAVGQARSQGPSVQDFLGQDTRPVPESLLDHSSSPQGSSDVPRVRYTHADFAALEDDYLWTTTWQMACMEVDLEQTGDHVVYDVADQSVIVVRSGTGAIPIADSWRPVSSRAPLTSSSVRRAMPRSPYFAWMISPCSVTRR